MTRQVPAYFQPTPIALGMAGFAIALSLAACGGGNDDDTPQPPVNQVKAACLALPGQALSDAKVTATKWYDADAALGTPGLCQVLATRAPYLDMEVVVPDGWSGRLWQQGGGGFDGSIPSALTLDATGHLTALNLAVQKYGAVYAASNGGNRSMVPDQAGPLVFVNGTPEGAQSAKDFAYASLDTTQQVARAVVSKFFAQSPKYSYFNGCSNGGRNAYIAAERWPDRYDGIVSGCEGMDMAGQTAAWMDMARRVGTPAMPSQAQWTATYQAALAACDGLDGVQDGIINNAAACHFDVASQACGAAGASADPSVCLSPAQLQTVQDLLGDMKGPSGEKVYTGYGWANWSAPTYGRLGGGFMALATGDSAWVTSPAKQASYTVASDYALTAASLNAIGADHHKPAIAAYIASGRKLLHWHDGADNLLSWRDHVHNVEAMHALAQQAGLKNPADNSRMFIVPGTSHAGGNPLTVVDWAGAITAWVEKGQAPAQLTVNLPKASPARTLPVCPYTAYPQYSGSGDVNLAASYRCVDNAP